MRLYILRHGITEWNKAKRMQGQTDIPLADEGIELALRTGMGMANVPIDLVISSPLTRAMQTAAAVMVGKHEKTVSDSLADRIAEIKQCNDPTVKTTYFKSIKEKLNVDIIQENRVQEISFGVWEGENVKESNVLPEGYMDAFFHDPIHIPVAPGGESFADVRRRTGSFLEELEALCAGKSAGRAGAEAETQLKIPDNILENKNIQELQILVSTHGAAGRCLLSHFFVDGAENIWRTGVPANCTVSVVEIGGGERKVLELDRIYAADQINR